jgi:hypothetical protein
MSNRLLPRLDQLTAKTFLEENSLKELSPSDGLFDRLWDKSRFAASGGSPASKQEYFGLREQLVDLAIKHGFPLNQSINARTAFDTEATKFIAEEKFFNSPEAMRDDVWSFICLALVPDIVVWRFPSVNHERFLGGVRNAFQRLWFRAMALDREPDSPNRWELIENLTEDAFVQITERAAIGADTILAKAIAEGWLRKASTIGRTKMEDIMRRAIILLRLRNQVELLSSLENASLEQRVDEAFGNAAIQLGVKLFPSQP